MSYNLYFYKNKGANLSENDVRIYLNEKLHQIAPIETSWYVKNLYTEAYYNLIFQTEQENCVYEGFTFLNLCFNLNLLRPEFFGYFAFDFIDKLVLDLDLYVLNPQIDIETPYKPNTNDLFTSWKALNKSSCLKLTNEFNLVYCPIETSNWFYTFNSNLPQLREHFERHCYVPSIMLMRDKRTNEIVSVTTWSMNIPNLFPETDYICFYKEEKRFFRTKKVIVVISKEQFSSEFSEYLIKTIDDRIVYLPYENTVKTKEKFFNINSLGRFEDLLEGIEIEKITNYINE